jgi:hypothetical protein
MPCAVVHHDCDDTPRITDCCRRSHQTPDNDGAPVQSRIEISPTLLLASMPAVANAVQVAPTPHARITVHSSPPRRGLLDLTTLFGTLLI